MIASKNYVKKAMENEALFPLKKFSQNFLINETIVKNIVNVLCVNTDDRVIEVGPGLGALTEIMLNNSYNVTAFEIDNRMCEHLRKTFGSYDIFDLKEGDFLKQNLETFNETNNRVISNLPYALTTPIIEKVLLEVPNLKQFVFMVQKEVVERLNAKIKTKEYSPLSIFIEYLGGAKKEIAVRKDEFFPIPNVDSTVFSINITKERNLSFDNKFYKFLKQSFSMRRKTLVNNLGAKYGKEKVIEVLSKNNLSLTIRPEEISLNVFLELVKEF